MAEPAKDAIHGHLPCGIEYGVVPLARRHVVSFQFRILSGVCSEPADKLGLVRLIAETIDKGTQQRTGRELSDAFDAIGASPYVGAGRETTTCGCTVLPEHFDRAVALHAEFLRTPTFPEEAFDVAVRLAQQELIALEDDAHGISEKLIGKRAFGSLLGRHPLGEADTLARIRRDDLEDHWRSNFHSGRMMAAVAGAVDPQHVADVLQNCFDGFGPAAQAGREVFPVEFSPGTTHQDKDLEQEHIGICWPGAGVTHDDFPTQLVILGILAGGMSGRLFTEVREKRGLVYWVSAWHEAPRGAGMIFMGASTTPQRCDQTYATLLHEVDRLADDVEQEELERAITGIVTNYETRGDSTRARCSELANDLFFFGRPLSDTEKLDKIRAVTVDSVRRCLSAYPRDRLCVVTLGPRALGDPAGDGHEPAGMSVSA